MTLDTLRVYQNGTLHDQPVPGWYTEACRLSDEESFGWHRALGRVLDCEAMFLTDDGCHGGWIEIYYWPTWSYGFFVQIETPFSLIEHVLIPDMPDWLPFLTRYLSPLLGIAAQSAQAEMQRRLANAVIAHARHGSGEHVDRWSGASSIDIRRDAELQRRRACGAKP